MKKSLFVFCPVLIGSMWIMLVKNNFKTGFFEQEQRVKSITVIGCAPNTVENISADKNGKFISVLPGWGNHSYQITTQNDSAQFYFISRSCGYFATSGFIASA